MFNISIEISLSRLYFKKPWIIRRAALPPLQLPAIQGFQNEEATKVNYSACIWRKRLITKYEKWTFCKKERNNILYPTSEFRWSVGSRQASEWTLNLPRDWLSNLERGLCISVFSGCGRQQNKIRRPTTDWKFIVGFCSFQIQFTIPDWL